MLRLDERQRRSLLGSTDVAPSHLEHRLPSSLSRARHPDVSSEPFLYRLGRKVCGTPSPEVLGGRLATQATRTLVASPGPSFVRVQASELISVISIAPPCADDPGRSGILDTLHRGLREVARLSSLACSSAAALRFPASADSLASDAEVLDCRAAIAATIPLNRVAVSRPTLIQFEASLGSRYWPDLTQALNAAGCTPGSRSFHPPAHAAPIWRRRAQWCRYAEMSHATVGSSLLTHGPNFTPRAIGHTVCWYCLLLVVWHRGESWRVATRV